VRGGDEAVEDRHKLGLGCRRHYARATTQPNLIARISGDKKDEIKRRYRKKVRISGYKKDEFDVI
jgi:hypothetical protein